MCVKQNNAHCAIFLPKQSFAIKKYASVIRFRERFIRTYIHRLTRRIFLWRQMQENMHNYYATVAIQWLIPIFKTLQQRCDKSHSCNYYDRMKTRLFKLAYILFNNCVSCAINVIRQRTSDTSSSGTAKKKTKKKNKKRVAYCFFRNNKIHAHSFYILDARRDVRLA